MSNYPDMYLGPLNLLSAPYQKPPATKLQVNTNKQQKTVEKVIYLEKMNKIIGDR